MAANLRSIDISPWLICRGSGHSFVRSTGFSADIQPHSGRRACFTSSARKISKVGGSLRDVQSLAGHSSLQTTQRYIEGDNEAKKRVVDLI